MKHCLQILFLFLLCSYYSYSQTHQITPEYQIICYNEDALELNCPTNDDDFWYKREGLSGNFIMIDGTFGSTALTPTNLTITTEYRIGDGDENYSNIVIVEVRDELTIGDIVGSQIICHNSIPEQLQGPAASGGGEDYIYQWQLSINGNEWNDIDDAEYQDYQPSFLIQTTYFRRKVTETTCDVTDFSNVVTITVRDELTGGEIGSSQTICYETFPNLLNQFLPVSGGSGNYSYQWEKSIDDIIFEEIIGAISMTYQPMALSETTYYKRKVIDNNCMSHTYSNMVIITVLEELFAGEIGIDEQIPYNSTPALIETTTSATGFDSYQWQYSINQSIWNNIQNATDESYQPPALISTTYYRRMAISMQCGTDLSNVITKHVYNEVHGGVIGFETGVDNISVCYNTIPDLIMNFEEATGGNNIFIYQWEESINQTDWTTINDEDNNFYQPTQPSTDKKYYRRKSIAEIGGFAFSNIVWVDVYPELIETQIGSSHLICYNTSSEIIEIVIQPTGGTGNFTYLWQQSEDEVVWIDIPNANQTYYTSDNLVQNTYFRLKVINICGETLSNTVTVSVTEEFFSGTIGEEQLILYGSIPQELSVITSASGGSGFYSYQWQRSTNGTSWTNIQGMTDESYQPNALFQTESFKRLTIDALCGTLETNIVTVTVADEFIAGEIGYNQTVCSDQTPNPIITVTSPSGGIGLYSIIWQQSDNEIDWNTITGENSDSYQPEILSQTTYYRKIISTDLNTDVITNIVKITVLEALQSSGIGESQMINYNSVPELLQGDIPTGGNGIYNYQWRKSENYGILWTEIVNATNKDYQPEVLTTTTLFFRISMSGPCDNLFSNVVIITVSQELYPGIIGNNQIICYNSIPEKLTGTEASGGVGVYFYQWQQKNNDEWIDIIGGTHIDFQPDMITEITQFRRKVTSGNSVEYSNIITIELFESGSIPDVDLKPFYCKNSQVILTCNQEVIWYDSDLNELLTGTEITFIADYSTVYYISIEDDFECFSELKPIQINVDFVDTELKTNLEDNYSVENGKRIVFYPEVISNHSVKDLSFEWKFINIHRGLYEIHYDEEPAQYFHWEGWYNVILTVNTPNECNFVETRENFFFIEQEKPDDSQKDSFFTEDFPNNTEHEFQINIFPNPFKNSLTVNINIESFKCEVFMITGQKIGEYHLLKGDNNLDTSILSSGVYIVNIRNQIGETISVKKLVKH